MDLSKGNASSAPARKRRRIVFINTAASAEKGFSGGFAKEIQQESDKGSTSSDKNEAKKRAHEVEEETVETSLVATKSKIDSEVQEENLETCLAVIKREVDAEVDEEKLETCMAMMKHEEGDSKEEEESENADLDIIWGRYNHPKKGLVIIDVNGKQTEEWVVERIIGKRNVEGVNHYRIKWCGWPRRFNTWEPRSNLTHCNEKLKTFEKEWSQHLVLLANMKKEARKDENGILEYTADNDEKPIEILHVEDDDLDNDNSDDDEFMDSIWSELKLKLGPRAKKRWRKHPPPIRVLGSFVLSEGLFHMVRIKSPDDPDNGLEDPTEGVNEDNIIYIPSDHFGEKFPQLLISYYESCFTLVDNAKTEDEIVEDAARAGLVYNLRNAKVNANYKMMYRDMLPHHPANEHNSGEDVQYIEKKKKKIRLDEFGLPYYYDYEDEDERQGIFQDDDDSSDEASFEEVSVVPPSQLYPNNSLTKRRMIWQG